MIQKIAKILIGQSSPRLTDNGSSLLNSNGYQVEVFSQGHKILEVARNGDAADLIVMDSGITDPDAVEICRILKADPNLATIPILIVSLGSDSLDVNLAIEAGCDDILISPISPHVLRARVNSLLRTKFLLDDLDNAERVLYTLARTIEAKDRYTMGHADRVGYYAKELGKALGVHEHDLDILYKGAVLHDIGKIAIPDAILTKPGKYTGEEFDVMKQHPSLGCDICGKLRSVREALPLIRHHHEKLDGSGYPDGLKGAAISPLVRVVSIVDIYDALRSKRSYKDAFTIDKTFEIMWQESQKGWWDGDLLKVWEQIVRQRKSDPFPL